MYCYEYIVATLSLRDTHVMLCNIMCSQDDYLCISECDIRDDEMTQISGSGISGLRGIIYIMIHLIMMMPILRYILPCTSHYGISYGPSRVRPGPATLASHPLNGKTQDPVGTCLRARARVTSGNRVFGTCVNSRGF